MPRLLRPIVLLTAVLLLAGLIAACGDDGGDQDADTPTATAAVETPEAEPTEEEDASPQPPSGAGFDSFHYTVDLEFTVSEPGEDRETFVSGRVEGDFVAPDSHAFRTTFEIAGISGTEEAVIIDDDAWYRMGSGDWTATTRFDPSIQDAIELTSADPEFFTDQEFAEDLSALDSESETINGVETRRYTIPRGAIDTLVDLFGEEFLQDASGLQEFEMTVWLEEETDALVRADFTATASPELLGSDAGFSLSPDATINVSLRIDVTRINDSSITIEPPI